MKQKKISLTVGIPMYNNEQTIVTTLDSILYQLDEIKSLYELEVLVSDNYSTDESPRIIKDYQKKYPKIIKYHKNKTNIGAVKNVYEVIKNSLGEYIWLLGDDIAERGSVAYLLNKLNNNIDNLSAVIMRANYYRKDLKTLFGKSETTNSGKNILINNITELLNHGICRLFFISSCVVKKNDVLDIINKSDYQYDGFFPHTNILLKTIQKRNRSILIIEEKNLVGQRSVDRWQRKEIADTNASIAFSFIETILSNISRKDFQKLSKQRRKEYLRLSYTIEKISSVFEHIKDKEKILKKFIKFSIFYSKLDRLVIYFYYKINRSYAIFIFIKMLKFYGKNPKKRFFKFKNLL